MVAGCPKCSARYRVDAERIGPDGAKLRCTKCSAVFLVRAPKSESAAPEVVDEILAPTSPADSQAEAPEVELDPTRLVLVADPDDVRGKTISDSIREWGLTPILVNDGVEAMLVIQRRLPTAVVLDAALPKMFGFQVCEIVKRNESLCGTTVVLIGAIHDQDRYRRDPSDLYGADVYVESPDLPDGLLPILRDAGLPVSAGASTTSVTDSPITMDEPALDPTADGLSMSASMPEPTPIVQAPPKPTPEAEPAAAAALDLDPSAEESPIVDAPADQDPERVAERERAQRLARIAVSEMVLYQPEKFDQASREGILEQALDLEIQEARALLRQRISEEVRAESDFIIDELHRVAVERGGQG